MPECHHATSSSRLCVTRTLLPLRALQALETAVRHGSFARAAGELHVTPAAISQQIKQLEDRLARPLFERSPTLRPTASAQAVSRQLREAFELLEQASRQLRGGQSGRPLVVSLAPSFASHWLIPRLERFSARYPDIELHLLATTRLVDFETEGVDAAVRYGNGRYPGLHAERLQQETVVAVAHPRLAASLTRPTDMLGTSLLHSSGVSWDATFPDWPTWLRSAGVVPKAPLRLRMFDDVNLVIEAVLAGLGVALLFRTLVSDELASGRLVALFQEQPLANAYHFLCRPERLTQPGVAAFRQWLFDEVEGKGQTTAEA
jgi:LysR family transcriptional regulator, glycine cleavage system transcriptional activator